MKRFRAFPSLLLAAVAAALTACVERTLTIETVPVAADVFLDGRWVGQSPVTVPFTFYGAREIVCRKEGYRPFRDVPVLEPPAFQEFPYDLYYETLTSERYVDHRVFPYVLEPTDASDTAREVVDRKLDEANDLRYR